MSTGTARPSHCHLCGRKYCQGDCKFCPVRLKGACQDLAIPLQVDGVWRWVCGECYLKEREG